MNQLLVRLLLTQFIAYCLANFIIVPNHYLGKNKFLTRPAFLKPLIKSLIFFSFSWTLTFHDHFFLNSAIISVAVFTCCFFFDKKETSGYLLLSQFIQAGVVLIMVHLHAGLIRSYNAFEIFNDFANDENLLWIVLCYIICLGPANVVIKFLLKSYDLIPKSDKDNSLIKAGRFIGNIERIITLTFVLTGQFEAIGLLIAAKSLLRLKENDFRTSEYVLVGTLLSFGIAIVVGIVSARTAEFL